ncbi:MAG: molybdopterin-binding protein [Pseudomonadota bacterium]
MAETSVTACVLIIGNEILSGRTQDVNLSHIATQLNEHGVQVREARVIPDVEDEIVAALNACRKKYDYVITTGGIGPTHDDITADCVAAALERPLYMHPEIEALLRQREATPEVMEARLRMARVPEGAELLRHPRGPAGFRVENVAVLAGVPGVMRAMLDSLLPTLRKGHTVRSRTVTARVTESQIAGPLGALQDRHPQVDIGSYPFVHDGSYAVSLVVRGPDEAVLDALSTELHELIKIVGGELIEL